MSNPTALPRVRSVVPSVEFEIGGAVLTLRYNFSALHEAGANPFDGSLKTLLEGLTPQTAAHFVRCGMRASERTDWPDEKILEDLDMMAVAYIIGELTKQIEATANASGLPVGDKANPPMA